VALTDELGVVELDTLGVKARIVDEVDGSNGRDRFVVAVEDELVGTGDGETELDAKPNELGRDLVEAAIDLDGSVLSDDAGDTSEESKVDLVGSESLDEGELGACEEAVERLHADAAVAAKMVVVAEPVLELLLQGVERAEVLVLESGKKPKAYGSEEPLDLAAGW
jgi:hypothetical protein